MNSKNHFLRSLSVAFRGAFILLFALSVFTVTTPTRAAGGPDLIITKSHTGGNFIPLENGRTYTITVTNQGENAIDDATSGMVTVVDALPPATEMTVTDISGTGWACTLGTLTCTRSDSLPGAGASYDPITVTVNVLVGAQNPQDNQATVSGGGDASPSISSYDIPVNAKADLIVKSNYQLLNADKSAVITQPIADQTFWIRMTVENIGGAASGNFYPGVFLDEKPNYGPDHDEPPLLNLGDVTDFQGYKITPSGALNGAGCMYYDPTNSINPMTTNVYSERGNYTRTDILPVVPAGTSTTVDVEIAYPNGAPYLDPIYDTDEVRTGLKAGTYQVYLYADPNCSGGSEEARETNNSFGPINLNIAGGVPTNPTLLVNSVLPTSRTPVVGNPVTIFNTVINAGSEVAAGVTLSLGTALPGTFSYTPTSCSNNSIIGAVNSPVDIQPGGVACYVLTFTPSAAFTATNVHIKAQALNSPSTNLLTGINTWLLRATNSPGPDTVALTTTTDFHQVACSGVNAFAVALSNVGADATSDITVTANTGLVSLPISVSIMESSPSTGAIIGDNILQGVNAGNNRTVVVFVTFNGCVTFDPASNRIFIEFRDAANNVVGSTSTAVSTNR